MSNLDNDFAELVKILNRKLGGNGEKLHIEQYGKRPERQYSLYAPLNFAWASKKTRLNQLNIGTKQKWADKAGIKDYIPKSNSQYNGPGAHWVIPAGDINKIQVVASYLARICQARHSS